jgi:hypothetical protein
VNSRNRSSAPFRPLHTPQGLEGILTAQCDRHVTALRDLLCSTHSVITCVYCTVWPPPVAHIDHAHSCCYIPWSRHLLACLHHILAVDLLVKARAVTLHPHFDAFTLQMLGTMAACNIKKRDARLSCPFVQSSQLISDKKSMYLCCHTTNKIMQRSSLLTFSS